MTREEEKREAARKYATHDVDTDETDFYGNYVKKEAFVLREYNAFLEGCKWSDENPKSPWISVKDDLPCNHKELIRKNGLDTKRVIVVEDDGYFLDRMVFSNNEWDWAYATIPLYWMPIPKLP